jgi:hypothetical protein
MNAERLGDLADFVLQVRRELADQRASSDIDPTEAAVLRAHFRTVARSAPAAAAAIVRLRRWPGGEA